MTVSFALHGNSQFYVVTEFQDIFILVRANSIELPILLTLLQLYACLYYNAVV